MEKLEFDDITKKQCDELILEEDFIITIECEDCGNIEDTEEEFCSECGGENVIPSTSHEDLHCELCGIWFDLWTDAFIGLGDDSGLICSRCMDKLDLRFNNFTIANFQKRLR